MIENISHHVAAIRNSDEITVPSIVTEAKHTLQRPEWKNLSHMDVARRLVAPTEGPTKMKGEDGLFYTRLVAEFIVEFDKRLRAGMEYIGGFEQSLQRQTATDAQLGYDPDDVKLRRQIQSALWGNERSEEIKAKMTGGRANDRQEGGTHYQKGAGNCPQCDCELQHWDLVSMFAWTYLEAQVIKYIMRWRRKNGVQDLQKARHFLDKLIEENVDGPHLRSTSRDNT